MGLRVSVQLLLLTLLLVGCVSGSTTSDAPSPTSIEAQTATVGSGTQESAVPTAILDATATLATTSTPVLETPEPSAETTTTSEPQVVATVAATTTPQATAEQQTSTPLMSATSESATADPLASATADAGTSTPEASATADLTATIEPSEEIGVRVPLFSYPIAWPSGIPGDGFFMRHGFDTENTWYNPGYWHTGEDWYSLVGDTAGAEVRAVADGEVVYAGSNYPGRVVIVRHADDVYSMYGHLDPALQVAVGQQVVRGALLGTVLERTDRTPNHLHFEMRTFVFTDDVNGISPRYDFRCGRRCAPGPGYWPMEAPELPDALGWRNPTHTIAARSGWDVRGNGASIGEVIVATGALSPTVTVWGALDEQGEPTQPLSDIQLQPGVRFDVLDEWAGAEAPEATGADAYKLWYRLRLADGSAGWVAALGADTTDRGSDGEPSSVRFNLIPLIR